MKVWIDKAKILDQLAVKLKSEKVKDEELKELSNQFYTMIPHRIGRSKVEINKAVIRTPQVLPDQ